MNEILKKETSNLFMENYVSSKSRRSFPISSVCNCKCFFCSNNQNPFEIATNRFIDLKTLAEQVYSSRISINEGISLSDTLPGKIISEGEAILHPKLEEVFDIVRTVYPNNNISIRTNGVGLTDSKISLLIKYKPVRIIISFHCFDPIMWGKIFNTKPENQKVVIDAIKKLKENGIRVTFEMVPLPSMVGYERLYETIEFMSNHSDFVFLWKPSWTKTVPFELYKDMQYDVSEMKHFIKQSQQLYPIVIDSLWSPIIYENEMIEIIKRHLLDTKNKETLVILTSKAAYESMKYSLNKISDSVSFKYILDYIPNDFLGGNIDCAGLLTFKDIDVVIEKYYKYRNFVLPPTIFLDVFGNDLLNENVIFFKNRHKDKKLFFNDMGRI